MSRIQAVFNNLRESGRKGLIAYVTAGCPDYETTIAAVAALEQAGADIVEIGMPFSDPMADGPIIQTAATLALKGGATTEKTRELVQKLRAKSNIPIVIMTYINIILNAGVNDFVKSFSQAGIDGIIVPDMPLEECGLLEEVCQLNGVELINFAAPTTTNQRIDAICSKAAGFLYCISNTGVTGVREVDYSDIGRIIDAVKAKINIPTAIGFGIGTPANACKAARYADAVIVGSAVMKSIMDSGAGSAGKLIAEMRVALDKEYSK